MSGTYQLSQPNSATMELFPTNPLSKRWQRQQVAIGGRAEAIYAEFWQLDLGFGTLETDEQGGFFQSRLMAGGLYNAILPHPIINQMVTFTGVNILSYTFDFGDIGSSWALNPRLVLEVNIGATGT